MAKRNLDVNKTCVVRDRPCGRIFSCSNTCFVACPSSDEVGLELDIIKTVLLDEEIEPYVAVQHFEPAREIFCTKICTKIIESKFCVVLLSGVVDEDGRVVPNANVYYEYGVMTAWRKYIIPLQRADQHLSFNIQGLDTLKYTPVSFKTEFEKALRLAIASTEEPEEKEKRSKTRLADSLTLFFELKGLTPLPRSWTAENTRFLPFARFNYGTILENESDVERVFYDTKVIIRRLERFIADLDVKFRGVEKSHDQAKTDAQKEGTKRQLGKIEWQKEASSHPTFTIVFMKPEAASLLQERVGNICSTLIPKISLVSIEELKMEMETL